MSQTPQTIPGPIARSVSMSEPAFSAFKREVDALLDRALAADDAVERPVTVEVSAEGIPSSPIRPASSSAPASRPPAFPLPGPGVCARDAATRTLASTDWPYDDQHYADDADPPVWVWAIILGVLFGLIFLILGYSLATLVQAVRPV